MSITTSGTYSQNFSSGGAGQKIPNPNNFASNVMAAYAEGPNVLTVPIGFGLAQGTFWIPQNAVILRVNLSQISAFNGSAVMILGSYLPLATPNAPAVAPQGTAATTTYTYVAVAVNPDGTHSSASAAGTTNTGNATLSATNFNQITVTPVANAVGYRIYRTAGGPTQGLIANTSGTATPTVLKDTGLVGDGSTAPGTSNAGSDIMPVTGITAGGLLYSPLTGSGANVQSAPGLSEGVQQVVYTIGGTPTAGAGKLLVEYFNTVSPTQANQ